MTASRTGTCARRTVLAWRARAGPPRFCQASMARLASREERSRGAGASPSSAESSRSANDDAQTLRGHLLSSTHDAARKKMRRKRGVRGSLASIEAGGRQAGPARTLAHGPELHVADEPLLCSTSGTCSRPVQPNVNRICLQRFWLTIVCGVLSTTLRHTMRDTTTITPEAVVRINRTRDGIARCSRCGSVLLATRRPRALPRPCPRCLPGRFEPVDLLSEAGAPARQPHSAVSPRHNQPAKPAA